MREMFVNSPFWLLYISLLVSYESLVLDQDNNLLLDKFENFHYLFAG